MTRGLDADVVVVGGGVMGSAAAWQLARRGTDVLLLERFSPRHTEGASHGSARIFRVSYPDLLHIGLAQEAERLWRELEDVTATDLLTTTGGIDHGGSPRLDDLAAGLAAAGVGTRWLVPEEVSERWPGLVVDGRALYHPGSGRVHADDAVDALQRAAATAGAEVRHRSPVAQVEVIGDDAVQVRLQDGELVRARRAVVAVGAWTVGLLAGTVRVPPLVVTQEQPVHVEVVPGGPDASCWPAFGHAPAPGSEAEGHVLGPVYGLGTAVDGVKLGFHGVGPVVDPDDRDPGPDLVQLRAIRRYVHRWLPGLQAQTARPVQCTYTSTPDSTFVLDRRGPLVVAAGFSGHGFKFAPAVGRVLADLADGRPSPSPFALDRFVQEVA